MKHDDNTDPAFRGKNGTLTRNNNTRGHSNSRDIKISPEDYDIDGLVSFY